MGCGASASAAIIKVYDSQFDKYDWEGKKVLSIDLPVAAKRLIRLLDKVEADKTLYNSDVIEKAIARYVTCWIPLIGKADKKDMENLMPPLDVEWVWCCHMLNPTAFAFDLQTLAYASRRQTPDKGSINYAVLLEHRLRSEKEWAAAQDFSKKYWDERISAVAQKEPWDWKDSRIKAKPFEMKIQYNILAAAQRQMFFNYQVKLPHYKDPKFLATASARYVSGFLEIQKIHPDEFWVPTYDIDLMWHAHMLHPAAYSADTTKITGKV
jgi:hypothetical protein